MEYLKNAKIQSIFIVLKSTFSKQDNRFYLVLKMETKEKMEFSNQKVQNSFRK